MAALRDDAPARSVVRLTRRGRLLLVLVLMGLAFAVFSLGRVSGHASTVPDPAPVAPRAVVVGPGDTVWSIAQAEHRPGDLRDEVARIVQANRLGARPLVAGETLTLPR